MKKHLLIIPLLLAFMACTNDSPDLPGVFSVSKTKQIQFSPGVLKYRASTDTWRFASSQLEYVGEGNENISPTYNGWIDLFGFGCSGYNDKYPYLSSPHKEDYAPTGDDGITGTEYDWGIHCQIQNGGPKGSWRLPTTTDWYWIFAQRENYLNLSTLIFVDDLQGLLVLPDGWNNSTGIELIFPTEPINTKAFPDLAEQNRITKAQFRKFEKAGAVFFPMAGYRFYKNYIKGGSGYWTSTSLYEGAEPWALHVTSLSAFCSGSGVSTGNYVRLVKDVQTN